MLDSMFPRCFFTPLCLHAQHLLHLLLACVMIETGRERHSRRRTVSLCDVGLNSPALPADTTFWAGILPAAEGAQAFQLCSAGNDRPLLGTWQRLHSQPLLIQLDLLHLPYPSTLQLQDGKSRNLADSTRSLVHHSSSFWLIKGPWEV